MVINFYCHIKLTSDQFYEYSVTSWNLHLRKHGIKLEGVQRRVTKLVSKISQLSDKLIKLKLDTLYYRRRRSDMLQVFRIIN